MYILYMQVQLVHTYNRSVVISQSGHTSPYMITIEVKSQGFSDYVDAL